MKTVEAVQELKNKMFKAVITESFFCGETTLEVNKEQIIEILTYLKSGVNPGYEVLIDLTAVDYLEPNTKMKVVYWLHNPTNAERVRVIVWVGRDEKLPTVTHLWAGADWYERELFDMFGIEVEGHPDLKRILMPDDWKGHPMRRDYPLTEEPVQFKHGVKPKVPSEIIHIKRKQKHF